MNNVLTTLLSTVILTILIAAIASLWAQGQAMIVPGWKFDHWRVLKSNAQERWFASEEKMSASEKRAVQETLETWYQSADKSGPITAERCLVALACRGTPVSDDQLRQLKRCALALHRRSLRASSKLAPFVAPSKSSIRRWKREVLIRVVRCWVFGARNGISPAWKNISSQLGVHVGSWTLIISFSSMLFWLILASRDTSGSNILQFIGNGAALGIIVGSIHGFGQIWHNVVKVVRGDHLSAWKFGLAIFFAVVVATIFSELYEYVNSSKFQTFFAIHTNDLASGSVGAAVGGLLFLGFLAWCAYVAATQARSRQMSASSRVTGAVISFCSVMLITFVVAMYLQFTNSVSDAVISPVLTAAGGLFYIIAFLGIPLIGFLKLTEHVRKDRALRAKDIHVKVRGYKLKYLLGGVVGLVLPFLVGGLMDTYPEFWTNVYVVTIIIVVLVVIFLVSFLFVIIECFLLYRRVGKVANRYRTE